MSSHGFPETSGSKAESGSSPTDIRDPIAIVGIGCRLPGGATDPEGFWRILAAGRDAITDVPADRWNLKLFFDPEPGIPGKTNARSGGFIEGIDRFDAGYFGISPREAALMDPQQRVLLEVAADAFEDAGMPMDRVAGTNTGVFVGISSYDYACIQQGRGDRMLIDAHSNTGGALSIVANRVSYFFNLRGTSLALDTACSSSMVAVHLACQGLWRGELSMALAGGVNVLIKPEPWIGFSRLSMLSPDGRCKAFDAGANGFVRAEGAGMLVLKPLSRAIADGDRVSAIVLATGSNQDGRTSSMTVPGEEAQEALFRETCRQAGISPHQVQYIEAHGTGTLVGDPIEARALGRVYGAGRAKGDRCLLGSVKSNIGHLEPAAGVAGIIKVALAMQKGLIPASLHFLEPNPQIPFDELHLKVQQELGPWPDGSPHFAGVNSFGFGGTNAHVIMQAAPANGETAEAQAEDAEPEPLVITLSARSPEALQAMAQSFCRFVADEENDATSIRDLAATTILRRNHHDHRLAVVASSKEEFSSALEAYVQGASHPGVVAGRYLRQRPLKLAFVCSGQGPQWWAMGRELLEKERAFREAVERCDELARKEGSWSLVEELRRDESRSRLQETAIAQPAIFALQIGLASLWKSWGVEPDVVVGHSVGEVAAAHLAGALSLEDAVRVIFHRGRCMDFAAAHGKMMAVALPPSEALRLLQGREDRVSLAAVNSPSAVTLSGEPKALEEIARELISRETFHRYLQVQYAFHSSLMDPMREELLESLRCVAPRPTARPMISTVTGAQVDGTTLDGEYWWQNVRMPVQFATAVQLLLEEGFNAFLELSPHPVLAANILECDGRGKERPTVLHSLRREEGERATMRKALAGLYVVGAPIRTVFDRDHGFIRLPRYPWQREHHWAESEESLRSRMAEDCHPILGQRVTAALPTWENRLDVRVQRILNDHRVQGHAVLPATAYLEITAAAAAQFYGEAPLVVEELELARVCFLADEESTAIQVVLNPGESTLHVYARGSDPKKPWNEHASAKVRPAPDLIRPDALDLDSIRSGCTRILSGDACYELLKARGLQYGPAFRCIESTYSFEGEALGRIRAPEALMRTWDEYRLHPAVMDGCLQVIVGLFPGGGSGSDGVGVYLPVEFAQVRVHGRIPKTLWSHARLVEKDGASVVANVLVVDDDGRPVVEIRGVRCRAVDEVRGEGLEDLVYEYEWRLSPGKGAPGGSRPLLPSSRSVAERTSVEAARLERELGLRAMNYKLEGELDVLCSVFIWKALEEMGGRLRSGERFSLEEIAGRCGILPRFHRVLTRYISMLEVDGLVRREQSEWEVLGPPEKLDSEEHWQKIWLRYPAAYAELTLLLRTGLQLAKVLRGEIDPLTLIFPEGSLAIADHLYQDSPTLRPYNMLAATAMSLIAETLAEGQNFRVLEVGAGTGSLASFVLPQLPRERTEYVFTDLSNHFFNKAEEKFRDYPFVQYKHLNIEKDPAEQELAHYSFDVVLASNVLHATRDLRQTVRNVRKLLASGGLLVLLEGMRPVRHMDLVFGLTEGFFRFEDTELRSSHALLSFAQWKSLLESEGFEDVASASGELAESDQNSLLLARAVSIPQADATPAEVRDPEEEPRADGRWLVFADAGGSSERLVESLRRRGGSVVTVASGDAFRRDTPDRFWIRPTGEDDWRRLLAETEADTNGFRGVIHFWNLDNPGTEEETPEWIERLMPGSSSVVRLVRALSELRSGPPRLWVVTRGAEAVISPDEPVFPAQAPVWGLNRVVINELPMLRAVTVDLSAETTDEEIGALTAELLSDGAEDEIAFRGARRYVHRWVRVADRDPRERARKVAADAAAFRLSTLRPGIMDQLALRSAERIQPSAHEVEIAVAAAGLNFSDVMKALGLYPGLPDGPIPLGIECAGRVTAVGDEVSGFQPGDEVLAVAPFSFGAYVRAPAALVVKKPRNISFEDAATIPIAFLTAHYALNYVGRLARGETVLIHSATGGVGLAAIQLARRAGAQIFATAGTEEKRSLLRSLGVAVVMDSRSLDFADEVMEVTGGRGVDLVLNSLSGEAIYKGLSVLADYGRFLEIGKRDIYQNRRLGMRPFRKNLSFTAIDLDRGIRERPQLFSTLFREVVDELEAGSLCPLPHRVFPITNAVNAFRHMSQARHVGKVVLSLHVPRVALAEAPPREASFSGDGTYLISGGLGGFGLATARWMAERGARHFMLMGRSGAATAEAVEGVDELRGRGAEVKVVKADVSDEKQLTAALAELDASMPPLRGVIHSALVLKDSLLLNMTDEQIREVWKPKVMGALLLHRLTLSRRLDTFVLYSSMSAVFGTGGQANYAAANSFLDALAIHRRARGLPGLSVSWGFLGETGFVARNPEVAQRFQAMGIRSFSPNQGLSLLGRFLGEGRGHGGVMKVDWRQFQKLAAGRTLSPRFAHLVETSPEAEEASQRGRSALRHALVNAGPSERRAMLQAALQDQVARVLGVATEKLDVEKPLADLGLDSLMAIELRNWVEGDLRLSLPAVELLKGPSVSQIVDKLLEQLEEKSTGTEASAAVEELVPSGGEGEQEEAAELLAKVDEMSDQQVDQLLERMEIESSGKSE